MSKHFRPWKINDVQLLPPSVEDYVPRGHLSRLIVSLVREELDLSAIAASYKSGLGHLPHAMALSVADAWTEKFARHLHGTGPGTDGTPDYRPRWYSSSSRFASPASLTGHLSRSLGRTISSSGIAPRSSSSGSASGGGGSSGGGGGGGGGW